MPDVEPLVALETNQIGFERRGRGGGERRLADAGLALEEERPLQPEREEQGNGQTSIRHVVLRGQAPLQIGDGGRGAVHSFPSANTYSATSPDTATY